MIEFEDVGFRNPLYLNSQSPQKSKETLTTNSIEMEAEFNLETSTTSSRFSYHYGGTSSTSSINKNKLKERRFFPLKHVKYFFLGARRGREKKGAGEHAFVTKHCNMSQARAAHCLLSVTAQCPSHLSFFSKPLSRETL